MWWRGTAPQNRWDYPSHYHPLFLVYKLMKLYDIKQVNWVLGEILLPPPPPQSRVWWPMCPFMTLPECSDVIVRVPNLGYPPPIFRTPGLPSSYRTIHRNCVPGYSSAEQSLPALCRQPTCNWNAEWTKSTQQTKDRQPGFEPKTLLAHSTIFITQYHMILVE